MEIKPIALTLGEPAGVGPEITVKAKKIIGRTIPFFVIGDYKFLEKIASTFSIKTKLIENPKEVYFSLDRLCVLDNRLPKPVEPGVISFENQNSVLSAIVQGVKFLTEGSASALVTNPINKWALRKGTEFNFLGHTDFLEFLDNRKTSKSVMMLTNSDGFRVVPVTIHIPIKDVSKSLSSNLIEKTIVIVYENLKHILKVKKPKILVTGLNPHAGENTVIGDEEQNIIKPVIDNLKRAGYDLDGPFSADSAFTLANRTSYDCFVCMYHDQALIPIKTLSYEDGINITLGLSFVRTSPDHGTALNIAGKNLANPNSLVLAIREAQKFCIAQSKNENKT